MSTLTLPRFGGLAMLRSLAGPFLIIMILAMMILPLPAVALDLLFTFNIAFSVMVLLTAIYLIEPSVVNRVWRGTEGIVEVYGLLVGFILFEVWVHTQIRKNLRLDRDLPVFRRYIGTLIETSLPTLILVLQIRTMGAAQALGFAVPLMYFIFVILSTLRLDFWLSAFTGFVAAAGLLSVALYFNSADEAGDPLRYRHS